MTDHPRRTSFEKFFANSVLILLVAVLVFFAYLAVWPIKVESIYQTKVINSPVISGGVLKFNFNYCLYVNKQGEVFRELKNTDGVNAVNLPAAGTVAHKGCHDATILVPITAGTPNGTYTLHGDIFYRVNLLRTVDIPYDTGKFQVINQNP